ncbi:hypothetical protein CGZ95_10290 [Enemella evansiae]|uniref:DUF4432 family protein n=1 Tax=Enemella evansiae TaxID=2016499 RepID=UPI000B95D1CC|nr:DUF4432 family protein [Enemella evansiae]OYO00004.1 hypothetical protein CGZ95_10290 [Enemella evansiae]
MPITLRSPALEVTIVPERGADIVQVTDLATGIPTLAVSPTGTVTTGPDAATDSMTRWLTGYPGGWQLLVPNAGAERVHDGVRQGYHGESALSAWETIETEIDRAVFEARLITAPLELHRLVQVDGDGLIVTDTVRNLADVPVSTRILQHPAFGAPFLDEHSFLRTDAATLIADAVAPGTLATPDACAAPSTLLAPGPLPSSVALPGPGAGSSLFAALTDFPDSDPSVLFASPTHGFGMRLSWSREQYPSAWFWIEANAGTDWPWFQRLYAVAVEPANVLPGEGTAPTGAARGGVGTVLGPREELTSTVRLDRIALASPTP